MRVARVKIAECPNVLQQTCHHPVGGHTHTISSVLSFNEHLFIYLGLCGVLSTVFGAPHMHE